MIEKLEVAFLQIKKSAGNLSNGENIDHFGRPSWWNYLSGVPLDPWRGEYPLHPAASRLPYAEDLKEFVKTLCDGDVSKAIEVTDNLIEAVDMTQDFSDYPSNLYSHLQDLSVFFRDVEIVLRKAKSRPDKYKKPETNSKRASSLTFCLVCQRTSKPGKKFCTVHSKPEGSDSDIKAAQRLIDNAFSNLLEHSMIPKIPPELLDTKASRLEKTANALLKWAKDRDEHKQLISEIDRLACCYFDLLNYEEWHHQHKELTVGIIEITKRYTHSEKIFRTKFNNDITPENLKEELILNEFGYKEVSSVTAQGMLLILGHMSKMELIKIAARKRSIKKLLTGAAT